MSIRASRGARSLSLIISSHRLKRWGLLLSFVTRTLFIPGITPGLSGTPTLYLSFTLLRLSYFLLFFFFCVFLILKVPFCNATGLLFCLFERCLRFTLHPSSYLGSTVRQYNLEPLHLLPDPNSGDLPLVCYRVASASYQTNTLPSNCLTTAVRTPRFALYRLLLMLEPANHLNNRNNRVANSRFSNNLILCNILPSFLPSHRLPRRLIIKTDRSISPRPVNHRLCFFV